MSHAEASAKPVFALALPDGRQVWAEMGEAEARLLLDGHQAALFARLERAGFACTSFDVRLPPEALLPLLAQVFARRPRVDVLTVGLPVPESWAREAVRAGVFQGLELREGGGVRLAARRSGFWQHPALWLKGHPSGATPLDYVLTGQLRHPRRPPKPEGEVYRRHIPRFSTDFSIRTVDRDADLETFNRWMNLDSVAEFWNERGSLDDHRAYLEKVAADPHMLSLIGCFDDVPFSYYEVYWGKEDRMAPFYDAHDWDRGVHLLVGDKRHRAAASAETWFRALAHYLYLDEPRTQRLVGDPRIDHVRWIAYMQNQGFVRLKEFDLPHKRSELIFMERETFFGGKFGGP